MNKSRALIVTGLIVAAAASRLIPHPPNVAPITALALFSGAHFSNKRFAFAIPLSALLLSDFVLGFYRQMWIVYGAFCLIACIGLLLRRRTKGYLVAGATLAGSVLFFALTNLGVWAFGSLYPKTSDGLIACYVAALPFFQNTILGDCLYTALLFGALWIAEAKWPVIREAS
ncbi:MAG TPA: DUF6580 family putative transport protein [Pyrinomonadaceae bacterium]|jgi:hypothetical protein